MCGIEVLKHLGRRYISDLKLSYQCMCCLDNYGVLRSPTYEI